MKLLTLTDWTEMVESESSNGASMGCSPHILIKALALFSFGIFALSMESAFPKVLWGFDWHSAHRESEINKRTSGGVS